MTNPPADIQGRAQGAIFRIFGVILVILGSLDIMLSWRGEYGVAPFHVMLVALGLLLCLIGAIRRQNNLIQINAATSPLRDHAGMDQRASPARKADL